MRLLFWKKKKDDQANKKKKPVWREWLDAGLFAIVAATIIRTFLIEAYTIPSGSMEGTMLVNDYLFVSKVAYGPRMPITPLSVPLVHNTMPLVGGKSYSDAVLWKYRRLPGLGKVKRYDVVVFNFPNNDTAMAEDPANDYYAAVRAHGRSAVWNNYKIITRPIDKKENYIKRCVGIPGDKIELKDGQLFVNGTEGETFPRQRLDYWIEAQPGFFLSTDFATEHHIQIKRNMAGGYVYEMEHGTIPVVSKLPGVISVKPAVEPWGEVNGPSGASVFPQDMEHFHWNQDNYGPIWIPKKGMSIELTPANVSLYKRAIEVYERNQFQEANGQYLINGKPATHYTFGMDYYWMMGDNRHNSADSRFWGFVPEDHIVGKASFVWMSYGNNDPNDAYSEGGIRWRRLFRGVGSLQK